VAEDLGQLSLDHLGALIQDLRELGPQLVKLLLDQEERLVAFFLREQSLKAMQEKPPESGQSDEEDKDQ